MADNVRRRLLTRQESTGRLPAEYQEVEWIESSGTQYINTNTNQQDLGFDIKFISFDEIGPSDYGSVFGSRYSSNNNEVHLSTYTTDAHINDGWSGTLRLGATSQNYNAHLNAKGTVNTVRYQSGTYNANGTDYSYNTGTINNTRYIYLFALHNNTSATQYGKVRMYYVKLYKSGVLTRDMVPCYRKADGVIGMYDLVTDAFFTNAGSGTFTKGGNV